MGPALFIAVFLTASPEASTVAPAVDVPDAGPRAIALPQIIRSAEDAHRTVRSTVDGLDDRELVEEVRRDLPAVVGKVAPLADSAIASRPDLTDLGPALRRADDPLGAWDADLETAVEATHEAKQSLRRMDETWAATEELAKQERLPPAVLERIATVRATVGTASARVQGRLEELLATQDRVASVRLRIADALAAVHKAEQLEAEQLFEVASVPLWKLLSRPLQPRKVRMHVIQTLRAHAIALTDFVTVKSGPVLLLLGTMLLLTVVLWRGGRRLVPDVAADPDLALGARILQHPFASSALLTLWLATVLLSERPLVVSQIILLGMLVAFVAAGSSLIPAKARWSTWLLAIVVAVHVLSSLVPELSLLRRSLLLATSVSGIAVMLGALRRGGREERLPSPGWRAALRTLLKVGAFLLGGAVVANIVGDVKLAQVLTTGTLGSASALLLLAGVLAVLRGLLVLALSRANRWPAIARHAELFRARGNRYLLWGAGFIWLLLTGRLFKVADPIWATVRQILSFEPRVGALDLSVADVFAFAITFWGAVLVARLVSFVLELGLENRTLARGMPAAISRTAAYAIVAVGVVLAFLASGTEVTRLAVVLGTLGVGIGFGLQDAVNNFVSGLILLYERPVQVGDIIEVGEVIGTVRRIGIRSSTLATDEGSEVVVPNGQLISNQVTNWTLSDPHRRLDVDVSVAEDAPPERVHALLVQVATQNPAILRTPPPLALFTGFGEGLNFQLRAWTDRSETWEEVASGLRTSINQVLAEAGIQPPQNDVRLVSVDPSVPGLLSKDGETGGR